MSMGNSLKIILEPRFVFDGAAVATVADSANTVIDQQHRDARHDDASPTDAPHPPAATDENHRTIDGTAALVSPAVKDAAPPQQRESAPAAPPFDTAPVHSIVFVDARLENQAAWAASASLGSRVVVLDPERDAVTQINQALAGQSGLDSLHILPSQSDDGLLAGRDAFDAASLAFRADEVASWRDHLSDGASIHIHGYDTNASATGQAFARTLGDLTGVAVITDPDRDMPGRNAPPAQAGLAEREIVVVDARVQDVDQLLATLPSRVERLVIGVDDNAIARIQDALATGSVSSLQIIAHGSQGALVLGHDVLTADSLSDGVAGWRRGLTADADILLFGCDVGRGAAGLAFVTRLADLTDADVAASTDATGSTGLGGNWDLEVATGTIDSHLAADAAALASWHHLLAPPSITLCRGKVLN